MSNYEVLMKLKDRVTDISYNDLLHSIIANPVGIARSFNNINTILDSNEINKFTDPIELLLFIEKKSRQLDCDSYEIEESINKQFREEENKKIEELREENKKLFTSIMESQGLIGTKNTTECFSCGVMALANGRCKC